MYVKDKTLDIVNNMQTPPKGKPSFDIYLNSNVDMSKV